MYLPKMIEFYSTINPRVVLWDKISRKNYCRNVPGPIFGPGWGDHVSLIFCFHNWQRTWELRPPYFGHVMSYLKFALKQCMNHVGIVDAAPRGQANFDSWSKIRPVLDAFNRSFKTYFRPHQYVTH